MTGRLVKEGCLVSIMLRCTAAAMATCAAAEFVDRTLRCEAGKLCRSQHRIMQLLQKRCLQSLHRKLYAKVAPAQ